MFAQLAAGDGSTIPETNGEGRIMDEMLEIGPGAAGEADELLVLYAAVQEAVAGTDNDPQWIIGEHPSRGQLTRAAEAGELFVARAGRRLAAAFILVCMSSPWLTACAAPAPSVKLPEGKWEAIDASDVFGEADGSFVLYDMEQDWFRVYRKEQCEKRVSPASTYKIYSGLFALEEGILTPEANVLAWDGTPQPFEAWEQDQTLDTAMKASVNWYFEKLDRALGISGLSGYYSRISYGNCDLTGGINSYWGGSPP